MELNQNLLKTAWYNTSFDPEKRAEHFEREYNQTIDILKQRMVENGRLTEEQQTECFDYWVNRLHKTAEKYLAAESRCVSWAIAGPAKFPVAKMEKRQKSAEKALNDYVYVETQMREGNIFARYMTAEDKQKIIDEKAFRLIMFDVDNFIKYKKFGLTLDANNWTFNAFPHLKGKFTTQAKNGCYAICEKVLEILDGYLKAGIKIQKNIDILKGILNECKEKQENYVEISLMAEEEKNGVRIVKNFTDKRLQLFFDGKPAPEIIAKLKANSFHWSPKNKAWQRILTDSAIRAVNNVLEQCND